MKLLIYQAGAMGRLFLETARVINTNCSRWEEIAFIDDETEETERWGASVYRYQDALELGRKEKLECIIAVKEPFERRLIGEKLKEVHICLTNLIHPDAILSDDVRLGCGIFIGSQAVISPSVTVGNNSVIERNSALGHDVTVGEHSVISARTFVAGHTVVGNAVLIGAGALIKDRITIKDHSVVAIGSVVIRNVKEGKIIMGNPGKVIGDITENIRTEI